MYLPNGRRRRTSRSHDERKQPRNNHITDSGILRELADGICTKLSRRPRVLDRVNRRWKRLMYLVLDFAASMIDANIPLYRGRGMERVVLSHDRVAEGLP